MASEKNNNLIYPFHTGNIAYIKENSVRVLIFIIISAAFFMSVNLFYHLVIIPSAPEYTAKAYADCLAGKDYKGAMKFFINVPPGQMTGQENIENALLNLYGKLDDIQIKNVSMSDNEVYEATMDVYRGRDKFQHTVYLKNTCSSFLGLKKEWKIVFPFKVTNISITGLEGSRVNIDGKYAGVVQNGKLDVNGIICDKHLFKAEYYDIASMDGKWIDIWEDTGSLTLDIHPTAEFRKSMEDLIDGFCKSWAEYCLSQNPSTLRPYLSDRLYQKYEDDTEIFKGSRFLICEYSIGFGELTIENNNSINFIADEKWHLKEEITDANLLFADNGGTILEQNQHIKWKYYAVRENGMWKLDGVQQISFRQEIIN